MRIIDFTKVYSDGHTIRYEILAENTPFVYVDGKSATPPQEYTEVGSNYANLKNNVDQYYVSLFKGNSQEWTKEEITYREESPDSDIFYGFTIKKIEENDKSIEYQCEYAGRSFSHKGLVNHVSNWQRILFNEWKYIYCANKRSE